jgi:toxin ParE1/3/4
MRRLRILASAAEEAIEAAAFYEAEHQGLGAEFDSALNAAFDLLESDLLPLTTVPGRAGRHGLKRFVLRRFPYDVVVLEHPDELLVIAIAHQKRRPGYWRRRLGG